MTTSPRLIIDPDAIAENARLIAERGGARLMAVVKADGYGAGAETVARAALDAGAVALGVTSIREALELRDAGIAAPLLSWLNPPDAPFAEAIDRGVELAVPSLEHLRAIAAAGPARVHLQLDCGMSRDGAPASVWTELCWRAAALERQGRIRVLGVMGHLSSADAPRDPANARERSVFGWGARAARLAGLAPRDVHLAATAAALTAPPVGNLLRAGAGLVGIDPSGTTALRGAFTLTAPVVAVRDVPAGTRVGYGGAWAAEAATRLATIPVGYADGIPRAAAGLAEVAIAGRRRPVVGMVSMDQTIVDVGRLPVRLGDEAVVLGPGDAGEPTIHDWARWSGTIAHEIVTGFGGRLERRVRVAA